MKYKYTIKCNKCSKEQKFIDIVEVNQLKWKTIAWNVEDNTPICVCPKCQD